MKNVMVDLETMGNKPGAAILSVGAVFFDTTTGLGAEFHERIDLEDAVKSGLKMDASTVKWWMDQTKEAQQAVMRPGRKLEQVLLDFDRWLLDNRGPDDVTIWGNGADFDNVLLASAFDAVGISVGWKFFNNRCYRTLKNLPGVSRAVKFDGLKHDALADAKHQARHAIQILREIETKDIAAKTCVTVFTELDKLVNEMVESGLGPSVQKVSEIRDLLIAVPLVRGMLQ